MGEKCVGCLIAARNFRQFASVLSPLKSHCQPQCIVRPNLLGGHFNGGIIDVSVFNP
jgi:hypothetical protein